MNLKLDSSLGESESRAADLGLTDIISPTRDFGDGRPRTCYDWPKITHYRGRLPAHVAFFAYLLPFLIVAVSIASPNPSQFARFVLIHVSLYRACHDDDNGFPLG